ncbi:MAG TPA: MFS transporter [Phycisphaerae bacterium]|nr:MFS transporter [Phycisphaerae bacterium]
MAGRKRPSQPESVDAYAALRQPNYRRYVAGWTASTVGLVMLNAAVNWELYERTGSALVLGLVGLFVAFPVLTLALPAGHLADTMDRRRILLFSQFLLTAAAIAMCFVSYLHAPIWMVYGLLLVAGTARAFGAPARGAMLPLIVPEKIFQNAVAWNSFIFHFSATIGPIIAGMLMHYLHCAWPVFGLSAIGAVVFAISLVFVHPRQANHSPDALNLKSLMAGAGHLRREKTILAAITLDLFAVLLGGATSLMPIYAKDILKVGAIGYGALRAAPYVGAFVMSAALAHRPPFERAGRSLLLAVAGFGVATIIFGVSTSFPLSLICLLTAGALDSISVVVRHVLVQVRTPDSLRGRVSAVNTLFIDTSNELGGFESGLVAKFFGPVFSVVSGGIGTILVVMGIAAAWPEIRRLGRITSRDERPMPSEEITLDPTMPRTIQSRT